MAWTTPRTWTTGELVSAAQLNEQVRDNISYLKDIVYVEFTTSVTVTATVESTPTDVISSGAITYAATPIEITFGSSSVLPAGSATASVVLHLWDGATEIGRIAHVQGSGNATTRTPVYATVRLTPTAGSHTYKIRAHQAGGNGTVEAGTGGVGNVLPGYIRIRGIPS